MHKHDVQCTRKRKRFEDDSAEKDAAFDRKSKFQIETFGVVIDKWVTCVGHRFDAYKHLCDLFAVLFMSQSASDSEVTDKANMLPSAYPSDSDKGLANKLIHFRSFFRTDGLSLHQNLREQCSTVDYNQRFQTCIWRFLWPTARENCQGLKMNSGQKWLGDTWICRPWQPLSRILSGSLRI